MHLKEVIQQFSTITSTKNHVQILKAKTKLAPIKTMTIPLLELSGVLLLIRLFRSCSKLISKLHISRCQFYTDSEVVLGWLASPPHRLKTFVANRVVEILEDSTLVQWNHVPSRQNPADCSSRGLTPSELPSHALWWSGPEWLKCPSTEWPQPLADIDNLPEIKGHRHVGLAAQEKEQCHFLQWMERFSSYTKLLFSVARVLGFIKRVRHRVKIIGPITVKEMREANKLSLKMLQDEFEKGDKSLQNLRPFRDQEGILRVGGRLQNSNLNYNRKHPSLLPHKCHMARLLIDHYHRAYLHIGQTALQAVLQGQYWIASARKLVRQRIYKCITCFKKSRSPQAPVMASLPLSRVEDGQVFKRVGIDFGGPFTIRESLRRKAANGKAYLCLFICMATRAVHLELVSNLTTEAFLVSLDRFISRRGKPVHIYSDCGTNFVGASNKLKELYLWQKSSQTQEQIVQHAANQEIQWSFNPPSAPHFMVYGRPGSNLPKPFCRKVSAKLHSPLRNSPLCSAKLKGS